jgi:hypothetical protein
MERRPLEQYTLTTEDVAEKLQYNIQYVRILAKQGKIPAIKRFRQWLFCEQEITEFFASNMERSVGTSDTNDTAGSDLLR